VEFFSQKYEKEINNKMMYYDYVFPKEEMIGYINNINNVPIEEFIKYIFFDNKDISIKAKDVMQFSNIEDASTRLCRELKYNGNNGVKNIEVGKLLLIDGKDRNDGAYIKYGENHAKTAEMLGLVCEFTHTYFVSSMGYIIDEIDEISRKKLLERLILRSKLIRQLICATKKGNVSVRAFLYMLSDSTYIRRRSNIKTILRILKESSEYDFSLILDKIIFY